MGQNLHHHWVNIWISYLGYSITLLLYLVYGTGDLSKFSTRGLFAVGFKEFYVKKTSCAVSVFYPMDKSTYNKAVYKCRRWLNYRKGDKFIKMLCQANKAFSFDPNVKLEPTWKYYFWRDITMDVCPDGEIAQFFKSGEFKLCPIVFSHGMKGSRCMYSTICQEMASHGYIVFALDHHDGSCPYTEDRSGK